MGRIVLLLAGGIFAAYGVACLLSPAIAANAAGLSMNNGDAIAEIGAMYGGFQTGFGIFCVLAGLRAELRYGALWALLLGIGMLAAARTGHALLTTGELTAYTWGAIGFEWLVTALAGVSVLKERGAARTA